MSVAFLFPGQGSQHPGMLHALPNHPAVIETLREASDELDLDVSELDSEDALRSTVSVQLALFTAGVAAARALLAEGVYPDAVAGLSVGAFPAAVISRAVTFSEGLRLVHKRAALMENAFPTGYGLLAILGLSEKQVSRIVAGIHSDAAPLYIGAVNRPSQIVVAGADTALVRAERAAAEMGARKVERLSVVVPSHCPLLQPVADALRSTLKEVHPQVPQTLYVGSVRPRVLHTGEAVAQDLVNNVAHAVRWCETEKVLQELGCRVLIEMNPSRVLTDLAIDSVPGIRRISVATSSLRYISQWISAHR